MVAVSAHEVHPVPDAVLRRMFEIMRLDQVFTTFPTAGDALTELRSGRPASLQRSFPRPA